MLALACTILIAGTGVFAAGLIWASIAPQWRRIARMAMGHVEPTFDATDSDRWRRVHLAADRRPFQRIRGVAPRRGLLGWLARR